MNNDFFDFDINAELKKIKKNYAVLDNKISLKEEEFDKNNDIDCESCKL